jgi:hypothetical protein
MVGVVGVEPTGVLSERLLLRQVADPIRRHAHILNLESRVGVPPTKSGFADHWLQNFTLRLMVGDVGL